MRFQVLMKSLSLGGRIERGGKSEIMFAVELLPSSENFSIVICAAEMVATANGCLARGLAYFNCLLSAMNFERLPLVHGFAPRDL